MEEETEGRTRYVPTRAGDEMTGLENRARWLALLILWPEIALFLPRLISPEFLK